MKHGKVNPALTLEATGVNGVKTVHYNLQEAALVETAVNRGEGELGQGMTPAWYSGFLSGRAKERWVYARSFYLRLIEPRRCSSAVA